MPVNVEIKARADGIDRLGRIAAAAAESEETVVQEDTFFYVSRGRLKLRRFPDGRGELIFYQRQDSPHPEPSRYQITSVDDSRSLLDLLISALGVVGTVKKTRRIFRSGRTRIHLDRVEGLGDFIEIEVVMKPKEKMDAATRTARKFMKMLKIKSGDLIDRAYVDLIREGEK